MQTYLLKGNKGFASVWGLMHCSELLVRIVTFLKCPLMPEILDFARKIPFHTLHIAYIVK